MNYYALDFGSDEKFSGDQGWFKKRSRRFLREGWDWPYWSDSIREESIPISHFDKYISSNYIISYVNFIYKLPPPLYCMRKEFVQAIGSEVMSEAFWLMPMKSGRGESVEDWVFLKEKPHTRIPLLSDKIGGQEIGKDCIYTSVDFVLILRGDIFARIENIKIKEGRWLKGELKCGADSLEFERDK